MKLAVLLAVVGSVAARICQDDTQCGGATGACLKSAVCIASECAYIPVAQFTPCGRGAVCNAAGVCEMDSRPAFSNKPSIKTKDNVLKIEATSGVELIGSDVTFNIGTDSFSAKALYDQATDNAANIKSTTNTVTKALDDNKKSTTSSLNKLQESLEKTIGDTDKKITTTNNAQDNRINAVLESLSGSVQENVANFDAAQTANALKFDAIDKIHTNTAKKLEELETAAKASGMYDAKTLPTCDKAHEGLQRLVPNQLEMCVFYGKSKKYKFTVVHDWTEPGASCKAIRDRSSAKMDDGIYTIVAADGTDMKVHCDMNTDGGGWTLVAYAGKIGSNKRNTVGSKWLLLVDTFGKYNANSPQSRVPFSQMKNPKFSAIFQDDSMIMAKRTSAPQRVMEFPVARKGSWQRGQRMERISKLRMANGDQGDGKFRDYGPVNVFQGCKHPCWTGYDYKWCGGSDVCSSSNRDNDGGWTDNPNGSNKISHRAMLYWEMGDDGYEANQWFHASPMAMHRSPSHDNSVQDIEFYLREK